MMLRKLLVVICLLIVGFILLANDKTSSAQSDQFTFEQYIDNPVIDHGQTGSFDAGGIFGMAIAQDPESKQLYMFYSGISTAGIQPELRIGVATSADGYTWEKSPANPIISREGNEFTHTGLIAALIEDDQFILVFADSSQSILPQSDVYLAISDKPDSNWEITKIFSTEDHSWDRKIMPRALVKVDDQYHLYYLGASSRYTSYEVGMAWTSDLLSWEFHGADEENKSQPILTSGEESTFDQFGVSIGNPLPTESGWEMFYAGFIEAPTTNLPLADLSTHTFIGHATSEDGMAWQKSDFNPLFDTDLVVGTFMQTVRIEDMYFIYYGYRHEITPSIGLITVHKQ